MNGGVALGVSDLWHFQPASRGPRRTPPFGWWVVKYYITMRNASFYRVSIAPRSAGCPTSGLLVLEDAGFDPFDVRQKYFFTSPA